MTQNEQYQNQVTTDDITGTLAENSRDISIEDQIKQHDKEKVEAINPNLLTQEEIQNRSAQYTNRGTQLLEILKKKQSEQITRSEDKDVIAQAQFDIEDREKELGIESNRQEQLLRLNTQKQKENAYLDNQYSHNDIDLVRAFKNNIAIENMSNTPLNYDKQLQDEANLSKLQANQKLNQRLDEIDMNAEYQQAMNNVNLNAIRAKMNLELDKAKRQIRISNKSLGSNSNLAQMLNNVSGDSIQFYTWTDSLISGAARSADSFLNIVGGDNMLQDMLGWEYASRTGGIGDWFDRFTLDDLGALALNSVPEMVAIGLSMGIGGVATLGARGVAAGLANAAAGTNVARALKFADSLTNAATKLSMASTTAALEGSSALRIAANTIRRGITDPKVYTSLSTIGGGVLVDGSRRANDLATQRAEKTGEPKDVTLADFINGLAMSALDVAGGAATAGVGYGLSKMTKAILPESKLASKAVAGTTVMAGIGAEGGTEVLQTYLENLGVNSYEYPNLFDILSSDNSTYDSIKKELADSFTYGAAMGAGFTATGGLVGAAQKAMSRPTSASTSSASISKYDKLGMALDSYMDQLDSYNELMNDTEATDADKESAKADLDGMREDLQARVGDELDLSKLEGEEGRKKIAEYIESKKADTVDEVIATTELNEDTTQKPEAPKAETLEEVGKRLDEQAKEAELESALSDNVAEAPKPKGTPKKTKFEKTVDGVKSVGKGTVNVGKEVGKGAVNLAGDVGNKVLAMVTGDPVDAQGRDTKENKAIKKELLKAYGKTKELSRKGNEGAKEVVNRFVNIARNPDAMKSLLKTMRDDEATRTQFMEAINKGDYATLDKVIADKFTDVAKAMDNTKLSDLYLLAAKATKETLTPKDAETVLRSFNDNEIISTVHTALESLDKSEN